jgi:hypothetical protein
VAHSGAASSDRVERYRSHRGAMRALASVRPAPQRTEYEKAIQLGARWLETARPKTTEDRVFLILGLKWAGGPPGCGRAHRGLICSPSSFRWVGGRSCPRWRAMLMPLARRWSHCVVGQGADQLSDIPARGGVPPERPAWRWLVVRENPDASCAALFRQRLPHGTDQFIATAATHWATMALGRRHDDACRRPRSVFSETPREPANRRMM